MMHGTQIKHTALRVNNILVQVIICLYTVFSFASCTTRQGKVSSKKPETFELIPLGCHNYVSSQSRQCFLRKNFLSSSAASLVHQNSLHELMVTKRVYYKCKSRSPKGPKPLSERNEPKWRGDRKSPAPVLHSCENLAVYFTETC